MTNKPNDRFAKIEDNAKSAITPAQIRERTLARAKADSAARVKHREEFAAEQKKRFEEFAAERERAHKKVLEDEASATKERDAQRERLLAEHVALASRASKQIAERQP